MARIAFIGKPRLPIRRLQHADFLTVPRMVARPETEIPSAWSTDAKAQAAIVSVMATLMRRGSTLSTERIPYVRKPVAAIGVDAYDERHGLRKGTT